MKRSASNLIIILLLVVIIVGVIVYASDKQLAPSYAPADGSASGDASLPAGAAGLVLSELMVENDGAVRDEDGDYPRWVELYNSTSAELSLSGYSLSDRENDATKYPLPAITLAMSLMICLSVVGFSTVTGGGSVQVTDGHGNIVEEYHREEEHHQLQPADLAMVGGVFLVFNVPTLVLGGIWLYYKNRREWKEDLKKMNIQDLE